MQINIIAVGKIKKDFIQMGIDEYLKRLSRYTKVNIIEVKDEKIPGNASDAEIEQIKEKEAERILERIPGNSYVIALEVRAKTMTSEGLAKWIKNKQVQGWSNITFIIGGAVGLHPKISEQANLPLSFSYMTFTHEMIRMILLEQVYRAFKIMNNEPYHL